MVETLVNTREKTHGKFENVASTSCFFKSIAMGCIDDNNIELTSIQQEGLDMIFSKIARILNGHPDFKDHWDDIAGYATLVGESLDATES